MLTTCEASQYIVNGRNFWSKRLLPGKNIFFHNLPSNFDVIVKFKQSQFVSNFICNRLQQDVFLVCNQDVSDTVNHPRQLNLTMELITYNYCSKYAKQVEITKTNQK